MGFVYIVADPSTGANIGELRNAGNRSVNLAVNRNPTASATIRVDHPYADRLLSGASLLKVYEAGPPFATPALRFIGHVAGVEEVGEGNGLPGSLAVTFGGPFTRFGERLLGKTTTGYADGTALAPVDMSTLVANLVTAANGEGYTGVDLGTVTAAGSTSYLTFTPYKPAADAINEVVNSLGGPDFKLAAIEPLVVAGGLRIATMDVKASVGTSKPAAAFEYGVGRRNVTTYNRRVNYAIANAVYGLPPSSNPAAAVVASTDAGSIATYGRREALVGTDLAVDALRQRLVDETVRIRKNPQQVITFQPAREDAARPGSVPRFGVDFDLGDVVPFRAVSGGTVRVNAGLRVYGVSWSIDANGAARPTFTLTAD